MGASAYDEERPEQLPDQVPRLNLASVIWPQLAACAVLLLLGALSIWLLSGVRAYVAGEGIWSKAQKDAVIELLQYVDNGDPEHFARFQSSINITLGDKQARLALDAKRPDADLARAGFLAGGNHPSDIGGLIALYRWFRGYPNFAKAISFWAEGDVQIAKLQQVANELQSKYTAAPGNYGDEVYRKKILALNSSLTPLENAFSSTISDAAREVSSIIFGFQALVALALLWIGRRISRRVVAQSFAASQKLGEASRRLQLANEGSSDGLWDWNMTGGELLMSPQLRRQLGLAEGETISRLAQVWERTHQRDLGRIRKAFRDHLAGRAGSFSEKCRLNVNGEYRWFHARGRFSHLDDASVLRFSGALTDITKEIRAERAWKLSEELRSAIFEAASDVIVVLDEHGRISFANPALAQVFGYTPAELAGQTIEILQPQALRAAHAQGFARYISSSVKSIDWRRVQTTGLHRDGTEFPLEISFTEVSIGKVRFFAAFLRDLSPWQKAQRESLRSKKLLDATQSLACIGGWEEDLASGSRVYWTEQMYRLLDVQPATYTPDRGSALQFVAPEYTAIMKEALEKEEREGLSHDLELVMVTARGRRFWVHSKSSLVMQGDVLVKRTAIVRDITLQKTAQQAQRLTWTLQRRTSERLSLALRGAELALWVLDVPTGRVTHAQRWEMFGYAAPPANFEEWKSLIHPDDLEATLATMDRYFAGASDFDEAEYRMRKADGSWVWVRSRGRMVSNASQGESLQYAGVVMDISAQMDARQVMQDQHNFLQAMVENIDIGVLISDDEHIIYMNASLHRMLGHAAQSLHGTLVSDLYTAESYAQKMLRRNSLQQGIAVPVTLSDLRQKDGGTLRTMMNTSMVMWNGRPHYITTGTPLSEQEMFEAQIRASQSRFERVLISELEAQQSHIARELHDSLGSELAGLALVLGGARTAADREPDVTRQLDIALEQVKTAVDVTRGLARGLTPVSETPGGLWRALERLTEDYRVIKGVMCNFSTGGEVDAIPVSVGNHLYRIAQEALANAVRHGKATQLEVVLLKHEDFYAMSISDNGSGFKGQTNAGSNGLGLRSMTARTKFIGGTLRFDTLRERGTRLTIQWPVARQDKHANLRLVT
ncbi:MULTISPECIES: PAS domain S-box protein [unclassified Polaromonas]|uniref:PAS domain-containing sensor histidine kinase n=1 Tax=unclassified Polaromonas TaxID=2638319 RepID=UPI000F08AF24|nr:MULTISPECIES: PAS domain S-box protein [unclassified Polaromonas]AYQ28648.1 PAS domain S-box protein [Polaromonas sp. SP1]QGJ20235.1 PAS domain S-box protein [Polaromonas sp. Pch-P]